MSWVGGKKALREEVVRRFPLYYERYIEVFGGGGWVLFHKNPGNDFEVYNDFNSLLTNLYRCVREKPDLPINSLRYVLNAREDFDRARRALRRKRTTSIQRAAWFYQIILQSYASVLTSFGNQPHDLWADFPLIEQAHRRLARVVIENKDFGKLIRHYGRPESLFYCDPPYHCTEGYYSISERTALQRKTTSACGTPCCPLKGNSCCPTTTTASSRSRMTPPASRSSRCPG